MTTDILLKPRYRTRGNILLPAPTGISLGQMVDWTWTWKIKAPHMWKMAFPAPWRQGLQHEFQVVPWVMGASQLARITGGHLSAEDAFMLSLWLLVSSPVMLHIES